MSGTNISTNVPIPTVPVDDLRSGQINRAWYQFFITLWTRSGGSAGASGVPGGATGNVQYNAGGGFFGGYTNTALTAIINLFSSTLKGLVPASGGGTTNFLRADGAWSAPAVSGAAGGDLSGTYPNPTVARINGAVLGSTTVTAGNLLIGSGAAWVTHAVSGDATLISTGALTLATVNGNVGTFGDATHVAQVTLNAKGLATAASNVLITIPAPLFGNTALRPATHPTGTTYFDTTLGLPIWWDGAQWIDAAGNPV